MRQHCIPKEFRLSGAILAPNLQHDVRAAGIAVFLNFLDAFIWRPCNRTHFAQQFVAHGLSGGFAATFFHGIGNGLKLVEGNTGGFQQNIG